MKKGLLKKLSLMLSLGLITTMVGCTSSNESEVKGVQSKATHTVVDTYGRYVDIPKDVDSVAILNSGVYDLVCGLGAADKVTGVIDTIDILPNDTEKEIVGTWKEPNVEKILEMQPDVVFGYKKYMNEESAKQIEDAGLSLVYIDAYKVENMASEISTLGLILGKEEQAKEYLDYLNKYTDIINERLAEVTEEEKVNVFWEGYSDYKTVAKGTGGHGIIESAGGINIAGNEPVDYPEISDEWVIEKNPDVIIKVASSSNPVLGLGIEDSTNAKSIYDTLTSRAGWSELDAVKNNKTYVISSEISTTPQGSVIGSLYLATWLYPDKFEDINPEQVHKEMLEKFYGLDAKGIWTYAPTSK